MLVEAGIARGLIWAVVVGDALNLGHGFMASTLIKDNIILEAML